MTKYVFNTSSLSFMMIVAMVIGTSSCKTKKNLSQVTTEQTEEPTEVVEEVVETAEENVEEATEVVKDTPTRVLSKEQKLNNALQAVSSAGSVSQANMSIDKALNLFSNSEAPVLLVIYRNGGTPDYDEPTTIGKYLDYLKDTQNKPAKVDEIVYDANGKIKELVLAK